MHDTVLGILAAVLLIAIVSAALSRPLRRIERALCAVAYGVHPTDLTRNADGILIVDATTATGA